MPHHPCTDPIFLLTFHGATPWYADRNEWTVGQLDELYWLAELHAAEVTPVIDWSLRWGAVPVGRN